MRFHLRVGGICEAEGSLAYELPDGTVLGYDADILLGLWEESSGRVKVPFMRFRSVQGALFYGNARKEAAW